MDTIDINSEMPRTKQNIEFVISEKEIEIINPVETEELEEFDVANLEPKEAKNISSSEILYHLRVTDYHNETTGENVDMEKPEDLQFWLSKYSKLVKYTDKYVASIEHFKRGMIPCKPHCHIYFLSRVDKETIRRGLTRWYEADQKCKLTGNKKYSLSVVPSQNEKAFKYCMKQQKNETFRCCKVSTAMREHLRKEFHKTAEQMREEAYAVWITACEVADAKEKKMDESKQFCDRLFSYLDKKGNTTDLMLKVDIQTFYIEVEKKPFNHQTAKGYLINYKVTRKMMNHFELAEQWGN